MVVGVFVAAIKVLCVVERKLFFVVAVVLWVCNQLFFLFFWFGFFLLLLCSGYSSVKGMEADAEKCHGMIEYIETQLRQEQ